MPFLVLGLLIIIISTVLRLAFKVAGCMLKIAFVIGIGILLLGIGVMILGPV